MAHVRVTDRSVSRDPGPADSEYVVVGSGPGGGTLAARLAESGHTVTLLEAGGDPRELAGGDPIDPCGNRLPDDYDVPAFHAFASENDAISWNFFVRHYGEDRRQRRDPKYREMWDGRRVDGILYPRAGTLGGCTAHNAMIMLYPHDSDWDGIATLTGDRSWSAENMRRYFERLENCRHRRPYRWLAKIGIDPTRHGWSGWLRTERAFPRSAFRDRRLRRIIEESTLESMERFGQPISRIHWLSEGQLDPNDWRLVKDNAVGVRYLPLTTRDHARVGSRERVLETKRRYPERLTLELNALVTRVFLDERNRAIGVEYLRGERLYRAHRHPSEHAGERRQVHASREVILSAGAFNTPQLLMLSGIGPRELLERHGIDVRVDLPGVGKNLQDRYEVSVVNRLNVAEWQVLTGATFAPRDPPYQEWVNGGHGVYGSNGAVVGVISRSAPSAGPPDVFLLATLGQFQGYFPGYASSLANHLSCLTWTVLKAHTSNRAGEVILRSADPCDPPSVNFRYFEEGDDANGDDLRSVVEALKAVRGIATRLERRELIGPEQSPGPEIQSDDELADYVRDHAWGHHASCTCPIGARERGGVLGPDFRVHGTTGLRIVDASVFPRIPGFFIVSAIYMVGEKAADVILSELARG
jgi:choline dehydrogenase